MTKLTRQSYIKITLIVVVGLLLLGLLGFGGNFGCSARGASWGGTTQMGNVNVDAASVKNLDISWAAGTVDVRVVDDAEANGDIQLVETASSGITKAQQMRWGVTGDTLKVDYGGGFSCFMVGHKNLEVLIPKSCAGQLGDVVLNGASGSFSVRGIESETLKLHLGSGEMEVQGVRANKLVVDVASGQMRVAGVFDQEVKLETASGTARISCAEVCPRTINADVASGSVAVALPESSGFSARVGKASGTFTSAFSTTQSGDTYVCGDGSASVAIKLASGEFRLEKL